MWAGVQSEKLRVIPYPLDCDYFAEGYPHQRIPGAKNFVLLYVFAFGWRKGFDLLLRAYLQEFRAQDDITLVLKVYPGNPRVSDLSEAILDSVRPELDPTTPESPHVMIMTDPVPQSALRALYAACDLYISTERASGWSLPCMEAMAMGKATATIGWGGGTEFMTEENCLLIHPRKELEPVDPRLVQANPSVYAGQMWPKVDIQEVRRVLRLAYEDRALLQEKGQRGADDIRTRFTFARVGERFREVLATFPELDTPTDLEPTIKFIWPTRLRRLGGKVRAALLPIYKT
jgi:glycosyltransferase involved in cell wall biosynthesis